MRVEHPQEKTISDNDKDKDEDVINEEEVDCAIVWQSIRESISGKII